MARASRSRRGGSGQEPASFGVLLVDKPLGPTSHDLVAWARWGLRERSIGHCGTLDPGASGLMVLCVGEATKLVEHLTAVDKRYEARIELGVSTTTADAAGEVVEQAPVPSTVDVQIDALVAGLIGPLELPPPAYSAIKINGRRAHELARAGELTALPSRSMAVHAIELSRWERAGEQLSIDVAVRVAKGTYVRSLAEELGRRAGVPAHLGTLRRTACGSMSVEGEGVVSGLSARELEPIVGRPPKWRIELGAREPAEGSAAPPADLRELTGGALRQQLREPWTLLPFGASVLTHEAGSEVDHRPALERLIQGQRLPLSAPMLAALELEPDAGGLWALVDRAAGRMIIIERELDAGRIAPRRVLRFPPSPGPGH